LGAVKRLAVFVLAFILVACARAGEGEPRPPGTLAASALPGLHSRARSLDAAAVAADVGTPALEGLLEGAGYLAGSEREFFGRTRTFSHVVARVLEFHDPEGASRFLDWVRSHPEAVLGRARADEPLRLGRSPLLFSLGPCGCHAEVPTFLAAWQRDVRVLWLLIAGPGVTHRTVDSLARAFDRVAG